MTTTTRRHKNRTFSGPVHEVMTSAPLTVAATTTFSELVELFGRHDVNAFPVIETDGVLRGIVTKLDLLRAFVARRPPLEAAQLASAPAADLMRPGILSVEPDDPAFAAAELMVESRLHSLPVVRRGSGKPKLVGMVSRGDLLRALMRR